MVNDEQIDPTSTITTITMHNLSMQSGSLILLFPLLPLHLVYSHLVWFPSLKYTVRIHSSVSFSDMVAANCVSLEFPI